MKERERERERQNQSEKYLAQLTIITYIYIYVHIGCFWYNTLYKSICIFIYILSPLKNIILCVCSTDLIQIVFSPPGNFPSSTLILRTQRTRTKGYNNTMHFNSILNHSHAFFFSLSLSLDFDRTLCLSLLVLYVLVQHRAQLLSVTQYRNSNSDLGNLSRRLNRWYDIRLYYTTASK